jgi:ABC-type transport system involved in cytochrome c biogenesis permease subunit
MKYLILLFAAISVFIYLESADESIKKLEELLPPAPNIKINYEPLEDVILPYEGRLVPYITFCRDILFLLSGKTKFESASATEVITKIILLGPDYAYNLNIIYISNYKVKKEFNLHTNKNYFSLMELKDSLKTIANLGLALEEKKRNNITLTAYENQIYLLYTQILLLQKIVNGDFDFIYDSQEKRWYKLNELEGLKNRKEYENLYKSIVALSLALTRQSNQKANEILQKGLSVELKNKNNRIEMENKAFLEYVYIKSNFIGKSAFLFFISFVLAIISTATGNNPLILVGTILTGFFGFVFECVDMVLRSIISSRAPVSSFYESIYYILAGAFLFSLIFFIIYKNNKILLTGIFINLISLLVSPYTGLNPHIKVLMPALKSKWLIYHVHTITLSYSIFAISFILGNWVVISYIFKKKLDSYCAGCIYNMIKIGVIFLTAGIILGSIWGAEAWGRYWGWDPKETWALITLLSYLAIIHLKIANTISDFGIVIGAIISFFCVAITYYGASFVFVGLHSYAGDTIIDIFPLPIAILFFLQILLLSYSIYFHLNLKKSIENLSVPSATLTKLQ